MHESFWSEHKERKKKAKITLRNLLENTTPREVKLWKTGSVSDCYFFFLYIFILKSFIFILNVRSLLCLHVYALLSFKPRTNGWSAYLTYQSRPGYQVLPAFLSPWLAYSTPTLNAPAELDWSSLYDPTISISIITQRLIFIYESWDLTLLSLSWLI